METFLKICEKVGIVIHWLTGWLAHPKSGGCCEMKNPLEKLDNENK